MYRPQPDIRQSFSDPQATIPSPVHTPLLSLPGASASLNHDPASPHLYPRTTQRLRTLPPSSSLQVPRLPIHPNISLGPTSLFSYPSASLPPSYIPAPVTPQHSRALYDFIPLPHLATQAPYTLHPLLTIPPNSSQMIIWDVRTSPYAADAPSRRAHRSSGSQIQIHSGPPLAAPWLLESAASPTQASLNIRIDNSECGIHGNVFTVYPSSQVTGVAYVTVLDVLLCVARAGASRPRRRCACDVSATDTLAAASNAVRSDDRDGGSGELLCVPSGSALFGSTTFRIPQRDGREGEGTRQAWMWRGLCPDTLEGGVWRFVLS